MMDEGVCKEKHKAIDSTLERHEGELKDHSEAISNLQTSDAANTVQIKNLVKSMSGLTKAIWGLVLMMAGALFSFFIWYVQQN